MADVELTLTVPDAYVQRALAAFNATTDTDITICARGSNDTPEGNDFHGSYHVRILDKDAGETHKQFAKRYIRHLVLTILRLYEQSVDQDRLDAEIGDLDPVVVDVPDEAIV